MIDDSEDILELSDCERRNIDRVMDARNRKTHRARRESGQPRVDRFNTDWICVCEGN